MRELRQLVQTYINGQMPYSAFRREFVLRFLSVRSQNPAVDAAVVQIELLCADAAEGEFASEGELKGKLADIVRPRDTGNAGSGIAIVLYDTDRQNVSVNTGSVLPLQTAGTYSTSLKEISSSRLPLVNELHLTTI